MPPKRISRLSKNDIPSVHVTAWSMANLNLLIVREQLEAECG
ncbi:hypothetical protein YIM730264_20010 [Thermus hydrothermalis]